MTATTQDAATVAGSDAIIGGADTHADTVHVAAVDHLGRPLDDAEFPTTPAGYRAALAFLGVLGPVAVIGVEGTSSYGAGLARAATTAGIDVREVTRPDRSTRRRQGKSDPLDAYEAARAVLTGRGPGEERADRGDPRREQRPALGGQGQYRGDESDPPHADHSPDRTT